MEQSQFPLEASPQRPPDDHGRKPPETKSAAEKQEWPQLLPRTWRIPDFIDRWYERQEDFTAEEKKKAWEETAKIVKDYSDELVKRWKEEIDTLLVYAGLFSAVLTALIVESYKLLSPPPPDPVLAALQQISVQLSSFSVNPPFVNSTQPSVSQVLPPAPPAPRWAVWLNALWFSSLIFSLSAASVGIMVKQWLNEYSTGLFGDSRHFARLRQYRLQNLERWRVAEIVAILPLLLQVALLLFLGGLLVLLWGLNSDVAAVASALIGILLILTIGASVLPVFWAECCYLSPQVYALFEAMRSAKAAAFSLRRTLSDGLRLLTRLLRRSGIDDQTALSRWLWTDDKSWRFTWRGRELGHISESSHELDAAMVTQAYTTTMYQSYLDDYASICLSDFEWPWQVGYCYRGLVSEMDRHQQDRADIPLSIQSDLWLAIKVTKEYDWDMDMDGLPDMDQFWEDTYEKLRIPTGASSHWHNHLWANALIGDYTSVAYQKVISPGRYGNIDYDHCSNAVRKRAVHVVEQELRKHGQKADYESLRRCSKGLYMLLNWVGASSSAKNAEEIETAKAIRALTRHGLLCHFKCYTTEAGKTISLFCNDSEALILKLRTLCEDQAPDFMTAELVDALVRVSEVHRDEFHIYWRLSQCRRWIMKLKSERDESTKNDHVQTGISLAEAQLSAAAEDRRDPTAAAQVSVVEQPHSNTHTSLVQDVHAEETEKEIATNTPSPVLSPSSD